jgi:hypothetical protein
MAKEKMKRLEDADYAYLAKYDRQLTTLLRARYLVGVGHTALEWMRDWWKRYTGNAIKVNENCANCVADFLDGVAKIYAQEKEARANDEIIAKAQAAIGNAVKKALAVSGSSEKPNTQPEQEEKPKNGKSTARQKAARIKVGNTK